MPCLWSYPLAWRLAIQVTIVAADESLYAATIDGVVAMKLGPRSWSPETGGLPVRV